MIFDDIYNKSKKIHLTETKRLDLPDTDFGLPEDRKFPLTDGGHVHSAIRLFGHCEESKKPQLAKAIKKAADKYSVEIPETTQVYKYLKESYGSESNLIYFDESALPTSGYKGWHYISDKNDIESPIEEEQYYKTIDSAILAWVKDNGSDRTFKAGDTAKVYHYTANPKEEDPRKPIRTGCINVYFNHEDSHEFDWEWAYADNGFEESFITEDAAFIASAAFLTVIFGADLYSKLKPKVNKIKDDIKYKYAISEKKLTKAPKYANENIKYILCSYAYTDLDIKDADKNTLIVNNSNRNNLKKHVYMYKFNKNKFELYKEDTFENLCDEYNINIKEMDMNKVSGRKKVYDLAQKIFKQELRDYKYILSKAGKWYDKDEYNDFINGKNDYTTIFYCDLWKLDPTARTSDPDEQNAKIWSPIMNAVTEINKKIPDGYRVSLDGDWDDIDVVLYHDEKIYKESFITEGVFGQKIDMNKLEDESYVKELSKKIKDTPMKEYNDRKNKITLLNTLQTISIIGIYTIPLALLFEKCIKIAEKVCTQDKELENVIKIIDKCISNTKNKLESKSISNSDREKMQNSIAKLEENKKYFSTKKEIVKKYSDYVNQNVIINQSPYTCAFSLTGCILDGCDIDINEDKKEVENANDLPVEGYIEGLAVIGKTNIVKLLEKNKYKNIYHNMIPKDKIISELYYNNGDEIVYCYDDNKCYCFNEKYDDEPAVKVSLDKVISVSNKAYSDLKKIINDKNISSLKEDTLELPETFDMGEIPTMSEIVKETYHSVQELLDNTDSKNIYLSSDWHLFKNHYKKEANYVNTQDIVYWCKKHIKPADVFMYLGDMSYRWANEEDKKKTQEIFKSLPGIKVLVLGNHDIMAGDKFYNGCGFHYVFEEIKWQNYTFTHKPIQMENTQEDELNIHGHIHKWSEYNTTDGSKNVNVYPWYFNNKPVTLDYLLKHKDKLMKDNKRSDWNNMGESAIFESYADEDDTKALDFIRNYISTLPEEMKCSLRDIESDDGGYFIADYKGSYPIKNLINDLNDRLEEEKNAENLVDYFTTNSNNIIILYPGSERSRFTIKECSDMINDFINKTKNIDEWSMATFNPVQGICKPYVLKAVDNSGELINTKQYALSPDIVSDKYLVIDENSKLSIVDASIFNNATLGVYEYTGNELNVGKLKKAYDEQSEVSPNYIYEVLSGKQLLSDDQIDFDECFSKVDLDLINEKYNTEISTIKEQWDEVNDNLFSIPSYAILENALPGEMARYKDEISLMEDVDGYYILNHLTKKRTKSVPTLDDITAAMTNSIR